MRTAIIEFKKQIEKIKTHLAVLDKCDQIIKKQDDEDAIFIKSHINQEKEFRYRSNIISLYGAFEHFIESIITEYIKSIQEYTASFKEWNGKITNNYFELWKKLHSKLSYPKYNFITEKSMVENIYEVIRNNKSELIPECFLQNGGNYKSSIICDMFNKIGIENINDLVIKYEPLQSYLIEQYQDYQGLALIKKELYLQNLNELVERRNEIAHGSSSDNIIDNELFKSILNFIDSYAETIDNFLTDKVCEKQWQCNKAKAITIDNVFSRKGNVALLHIEDFTKDAKTLITVGNKLLVNYKENDRSRFFSTAIKEIRIDMKSGEKNKIVKEILVDDNVEQITIEVSCAVKTKQKIKIMPS